MDTLEEQSGQDAPRDLEEYKNNSSNHCVPHSRAPIYEGVITACGGTVGSLDRALRRVVLLEPLGIALAMEAAAEELILEASLELSRGIPSCIGKKIRYKIETQGEVRTLQGKSGELAVHNKSSDSYPKLAYQNQDDQHEVLRGEWKK